MKIENEHFPSHYTARENKNNSKKQLNTIGLMSVSYYDLWFKNVLIILLSYFLIS